MTARRSSASVVVLVWAALACVMPSPAEAATSQCEPVGGRNRCWIDAPIGSDEERFSPSHVATAQGDEIVWRFLGSGFVHKLESWRSTPNAEGRSTSFSSDVLGPDANQEFRIEFAGGTVEYRCVVHSRLQSDSSTGSQRCTGACGVLSDEPPALPARPSFVAPADGTTLHRGYAVDLEGRAPKGVSSVRVKHRWNDGTSTDLGFARVNASGIWTLRVPRQLGDGEHTFLAWTVAPSGFESGPSFHRLLVDTSAAPEDVVRPMVELTRPVVGSPPARQRIEVSGSARDNLGVTSISIALADQTGRRWLHDVVPETDRALGPSTTAARFWAHVRVPAGVYSLHVRAFDHAGNSSKPARVDHVLVLD